MFRSLGYFQLQSRIFLDLAAILGTLDELRAVQAKDYEMEYINKSFRDIFYMLAEKGLTLC